MSKSDIFSLVIIVLFVICQLFISWTNTHKTKNSEWLNMMKDFANAYVHNFKQVDIDGHEKMKNVVSAVTTTMEQHGKKVTAEDQKLIEAVSQSIYDKMINDDKKTDAINALAGKDKQSIDTAETYEEDTDESKITDLRANVPDYPTSDPKQQDQNVAPQDTSNTTKPETVERYD